MILLGYVAAAEHWSVVTHIKRSTTLDYKASEDHICVQQLAFTPGWLTMFFYALFF